MRQRTFAALATGVLGLIAVAPAMAADGQPSAPTASTTTSSGPATTPTSSMSPTSSTTATTAMPQDDMGDDPSSDRAYPSDPADDSADDTAADDTAADDTAADDTAAPDSACQDAKEQVPAPAEGDSELFDAGDAGTVEIGRVSATELEILSVTPEDGWTEKVAAASGPRVKVRFTNDAAPDEIIRFTASLTSDGSELRVKVSDCQA